MNILIAEGTPAVWQAERAGFGLPSNFSLFAAAVRLHCPDIRCMRLNIADGEASEPIHKVVESEESVVIPSLAPASLLRGAECGSLNTAVLPSAMGCAIRVI